MADLGETFDPGSVPESDRNFDPMPAGIYQVQVTESEIVDIKSGNGQSLVLTFEVMGGPFENRKLWDRLNIRHTSEQAQSIAQRALADLFIATNTPPSRNSDDLHFKPCLAKVVIVPAKDGYAAKNEIKGYKALGNATAATPAKKAVPVARTSPVTSVKPATGGGSTSWRRPLAAQPAKVDDEIPF